MSIRKMKERPVSERPYEKCLAWGPERLSDGELLAVLIRCGTRENCAADVACDLLNKHPVNKGLAGLYHLDRESLKEIPGIGEVKATEILCVLELSRRLARASLEAKEDFSAPEYVARYYMEEMRHLDREIVRAVFLDARHRLLREMVLSDGAVNQAPVSIKKLFEEAVRCGACHIILLHNHPSGIPEPSREDLLFTVKVQKAGEILDIPLSDHIIIGDQCYHSMLEEGQL